MVTTLFTPGKIGKMRLPNRLVRSATAEFMADADGRPKPELKELYRELVRGGVGLIITGHMYIDPGGKANPEMTGIYSDELLPGLTELVQTVHDEGGHVVVQINHGGMQCSRQTVQGTIAPSAIEVDFLKQPAREMTVAEIELVIDTFAQAARRAKAAGFDGVQIHAAHGYLVSQFLSSFVNKRTDEWGGGLQGRMRFLREVCRAVRQQVGPGYPVLTKLGLADMIKGGLTLEEGLQVVAALESMGLDAVEISAGIGGRTASSVRTGIRTEADEGYFRPSAQEARRVTRLPIILVGGFRSRKVMEDVLAAGDADFISMCRPLICEPDFPNRLRHDLQERSSCISANRCWPEAEGAGVGCKCPIGDEKPETRH
jgi:2,4-dienoyl-CoA reductase-like NADH-dependent reductase (Old Yellow Enzyme family)